MANGRSSYFGDDLDMSFDLESSLVMSMENWYQHCYENGLVSGNLRQEVMQVIEEPANNQENSDNEHQELPQNIAMLSEEQRDLVEIVRGQITYMLSKDKDKAKIKFILLTGYAGTGKTYTLAGIRDIPNSSILYVANTKSLCASVGAKFNLPTMNLCRFFMNALGLCATDALNLMDRMQMENYIEANPVINRYFLENMIANRDFVVIIFFDEFSMFSPHALQLFIKILETASSELGAKFLIIFCGDFMHIPPLFTASTDYKPVRDKFNIILNFTTQLRIADEPYMNVISRLVDSPVMPAPLFLEELRRVVPGNWFSPQIQYTFPLEYIQRAYQSLRTSSKLDSWLEALPAEFFSKVLTLRAYAYTNREVHCLNLNLAFTIVKQLTDLGNDFEFISSFVYFARFDADSENPLKIIPLIRFFPYRILVESPGIYIQSIVHLVDWDFNKGYVTLYYPHKEQIVQQRFCHFYFNLYPQVKFYGVPLELTFASTFHKAQGETFAQDIAVSLSNIDHRELFAILSRIHLPQQIKNLYYRVNPDP